MRCSAAVGCAGRLGGGLTASGCARWLTGVGLTATFAVDLALVRAARRGGAFFAASFLIVLVFLTAFLRLAVLVTVVFLRFALALVFVAMTASLMLTPFGKSSSDRPRRERPRDRRATEQCDALAPPHHSITSSARTSSVGGTSMPSALAVLRLIASSYFVGA